MKLEAAGGYFANLMCHHTPCAVQHPHPIPVPRPGAAEVKRRHVHIPSMGRGPFPFRIFSEVGDRGSRESTLKSKCIVVTLLGYEVTNALVTYLD